MCSAACLSERNHLVRRISKTDIFKGSVPRSNWYCPNRRWIINISESAHSSHKKQCNGMINFSIHHQWWWWRWKSCHRGLVSPPGWLSSGDLRWQFACRLQPPSAPTRGSLKAGLFSRLSNKAGANLVTTLQSNLCNMPSCHLGTSQTPTPKAVFLSVSFSPKSHTGPLQRRWVPFVFSLSELYFWRQWTHNQPCLQDALNAMVRLAI